MRAMNAMNAVTSAASRAASSINHSVNKRATSNNPPSMVPGSDSSLSRDSVAFYDCLSEVHLTERAIEDEMKPGGALECYSLTPDDDDCITYDMWLGGLRSKTVICRSSNTLEGVSFATLEKSGSCSSGCCRLDQAPFCGLCRCMLYHRYKLAIKTSGRVEIVNNFPQRSSHGCDCRANCIQCCSIFTCLTCGEFQSKEKTKGWCIELPTRDGLKIQAIEEQINRQRDFLRAATAGAQRRGVQTANMYDVIMEDKPYFRNFRAPPPTSTATMENDDQTNSEFHAKQPPAAVPVAATTKEYGIAMNAPEAVAVPIPMER